MPEKRKIDRDNIKAVFIRLEVDSKTFLSVLLHSDGTVNRSGNGKSESDGSLYVAMSGADLFKKFMSIVTDDVLKFGGQYDMCQNMKGDKCKLTIFFDGGPQYEFLYGSDSEGPPLEICNLVQKAVLLTDYLLKE